MDNLDDIGELEACVQNSATFIIFLSFGYFVSMNWWVAVMNRATVGACLRGAGVQMRIGLSFRLCYDFNAAVYTRPLCVHTVESRRARDLPTTSP